MGSKFLTRRSTVNISSWFDSLAWHEGVWVNVWKVFIVYICAQNTVSLINWCTRLFIFSGIPMKKLEQVHTSAVKY
jgi:hypothetical protein